jgi:hypothetical protein
MAILIAALSAQPSWSDIPLIVLTSGGGETPLNVEALAKLSEAGNVTLIERPVRLMTLMSAIKSALRARDDNMTFVIILLKKNVLQPNSNNPTKANAWRAQKPKPLAG